jgi:hypothetical protein
MSVNAEGLSGVLLEAFPSPDNTSNLVVTVTHPAVFAVKPVGSLNALTTASPLKYARPGVPVMAAMTGRNDTWMTFPERFELRQPPLPLRPGIGRLEIAYDEDARRHCRIEVEPSEAAADFAQLLPKPDADYKEPTHDDFFFDRGDELSFRCAPGAQHPLRLDFIALGLPGATNFRWKLHREQPPTPPTSADASGLVAITTRAANELWLHLRSARAYPPVDEKLDPDVEYDELLASDAALFTVAPVIFSAETDEPLRLFMVRVDDDDEHLDPGNFGTLAEMVRAAVTAKIDCVLFTPAEGHDDYWAQDAVHFGHCVTPNRTQAVFVQSIRASQTKASFKAGLETQITDYLADDASGLFTELPELLGKNEWAGNSRDYGGNLVATPPVLTPTTARDHTAASRGFPAHPKSPYGKLILGHSIAARPTQTHFTFVEAQKVQPIIPIDTSWLSVGHADELVSFVPAKQPCQYTKCGERGWAMLFACPDLAIELATLASAEQGVFFSPVGITAQVVTMYTVTNDGVLDRNAHPETRRLDETLGRIRHGLAAALADVIQVPVLFSPGGGKKVATFPNMVNHVGLGARLAIPKPWGPRVPAEKAAALLAQLGKYGISEPMIESSNIETLQVQYCWLYGDDSNVESDLVRLYGRDGVEDYDLAIGPGARILRKESGPLPPGFEIVPPGWRCYVVRLGSIDVFEAWMVVRLRQLGLDPWFIDDTLYHTAGGELHCGSKVMRKPRPVTHEDRWWHTWQSFVAVDLPW